MGNVSQIVPSIHPVYCIGEALNHTREFTDVAGRCIVILLYKAKRRRVITLKSFSQRSLLTTILQYDIV